MSADSTLTAEGAPPLFILAMDHRDSLAKKVYGIAGDPTPDERIRIAADKLAVFEGAAAAIGGLPEGRPGVLVDERYGAEVARSARQAGFTLIMPIERSGQDFFQLEYGGFDSSEWLDHLARFGPDAAKVLVRDNPGFDDEKRRLQQDHLALVSARLREARIPLIIELLVPDASPTPTDDYDDAIRPGLTVELLREFHAHGVEPDIWKLEGYNAALDAAMVAAAAREGGRSHVGCIVLGRDSDEPHLDHWLQVAASIDGFVGYAVGRSIWEQPLADELAGRIDGSELQRRVGESYLHYSHVYAAARRATLTE
ncbi:2-deoxy-5-keto-D-gluconate 6-phosphate aldolase domain-containing protein [Leifsonia sp. LS-T14]|uniref:2-deoxy-5-keto-D-gluconate 6-phosphate aldolase domain-containing protein n=1 Tax=unclassified Leifsonia TaxID=2663824 RepID=UPI0035A66ED6